MSNQYEQNVTTLAAPGSFQFPAPADQDVDTADLNEDLAGLGMSLPRVKIPGGSVPQFKMPSEDPNDPTYVSEIEGVILYNHDANPAPVPVHGRPHRPRGPRPDVRRLRL